MTSSPFELVKHLNNKLLIGGKLVTPLSKKSFPVVNPATMEVIGEAAEAHEADIDLALKAWRKLADSLLKGRRNTA